MTTIEWLELIEKLYRNIHSGIPDIIQITVMEHLIITTITGKIKHIAEPNLFQHSIPI